jgi:uncharacterized protein YycO
MRITLKYLQIGAITLVGIIGTVVLIVVLIDQAEMRQEESSTYALGQHEKKLIKHGDVILRKGYGMVSHAIATKLDGKYSLSHCGVIVESEAKFFVVHTVASEISEVDGMQIETLDEFVRQSSTGSIVVNRLLNDSAAAHVAEGALEYLSARVGFDKNFDITDSSRFYCSELIWRCLKNKAGIDLFEGLYDQEGAWYSFDHFFNPKHFRVVINHQESMGVSLND